MSLKAPKKGKKHQETDDSDEELDSKVVRLAHHRDASLTKLKANQRRLPCTYTKTGETFQLRPGVKKSAIDVLRLTNLNGPFEYSWKHHQAVRAGIVHGGEFFNEEEGVGDVASGRHGLLALEELPLWKRVFLPRGLLPPRSRNAALGPGVLTPTECIPR